MLLGRLDIVENGLDIARAARNESWLAFIAEAGFQLVAELIGEYANVVRFIHPILVRPLPAREGSDR